MSLHNTKLAVQFTDEILLFNTSYFQPNMRADIVDAQMLSDTLVEIVFSVERFDQWNVQFEQSYDADMSDFFTVEVPLAPRDKDDEPNVERLVVPFETADTILRPIDDKAVALYERYLTHGLETYSYVEWLETQLIYFTDDDDEEEIIPWELL